MRILKIQNFISNYEAEQLNQWVDTTTSKQQLTKGIISTELGYQYRFTSRFNPEKYEYPELVYNINRRIRKEINIENSPIIRNHGKDGIVVSNTLVGGNLFPHTDLMVYEGLHILRCNILTRKPKRGGILKFEGKEIEIEPLELHCYLASKYMHEVSTVEEGPSRILWMFGGCIKEEDWE